MDSGVRKKCQNNFVPDYVCINVHRFEFQL
ncbi:hypothetical protein BH10ACI3_BH10ACI3_25870 [soil metagenome]